MAYTVHTSLQNWINIFHYYNVDQHDHNFKLFQGITVMVHINLIVSIIKKSVLVWFEEMFLLVPCPNYPLAFSFIMFKKTLNDN